MNRGLLEKAFREIWPVTLAFGLLLVLAELVITFVLPAFETELYTLIAKLGFLRTLLSALLGTPITKEMGTDLLKAIPWVHPLVLLIFFAHEITITTRLPVGEIDRGTIDLLLGLPVSRWQVYTSHSLIWAFSGISLFGFGLMGNWIGSVLASSTMAEPGRLAIAIVNAYCLYISIGGLAYLVSCSSDRRGRAIGTILAIVVASFLINFLAEFWKPAEHIRFVSLLSYYRPFFILKEPGFPLGDVAVLLSLAVLFWVAGGVVFRRRDVCTL